MMMKIKRKVNNTYSNMHPLNQSWTVGEKIVAIIFILAFIAILCIIVFTDDNIQFGCKYVVYSRDNTQYFTNSVTYTDGGVKFIDVRTGCEIVLSDYTVQRYPYDDSERRVLQ